MVQPALQPGSKTCRSALAPLGGWHPAQGSAAHDDLQDQDASGPLSTAEEWHAAEK